MKTLIYRLLLIFVVAAMLANAGINAVNLSRESRYNRLTESRGRLQGFLAQKLREKCLSADEAVKLLELEREAEVPVATEK